MCNFYMHTFWSSMMLQSSYTDLRYLLVSSMGGDKHLWRYLCVNGINCSNLAPNAGGTSAQICCSNPMPMVLMVTKSIKFCAQVENNDSWIAVILCIVVFSIWVLSFPFVGSVNENLIK